MKIKLVLLGLCTALAVQQSFSQKTAQIDSLLARQIAAWNRGDIEGYMEGYWQSDSLIFTSGGKIQRGWKATFEKYKKTYDTPAKMGKLEFSDVEIMSLSKKSAWVFGHWKLAREKDQPGGVFTLILRKFPVGWRIVHDHTSVGNEDK